MPSLPVANFSLSILVGLALFVAGCKKGNEQIQVYRLIKAPLESPSDEQAPAPPVGSMDGVAAPFASNAQTSAPVPANWEPQPLSQMRQASFLAHGDNGAQADISFVTLGPAAGNVLENVNRWLAQLGQPPITAEQLTTSLQKLATPEGEVDVVDLTGKPENGDASKDGRIVAAMAVEQGKTGFYKIRGNATLVEKEKENFLKWVTTMRSGSTSTAASAPSGGNSDKPEIKWDIPAGWSPAPASAMRYASFAVNAVDGEKLDVSVVTFPGDGGGDLENINRWRQQIGLGAVDENAVVSLTTPVKNAAATFSLVDFTGVKSRMVAAWTRQDGRSWFFKLTGPATGVEKEKPNFVKFVESVRF